MEQELKSIIDKSLETFEKNLDKYATKESIEQEFKALKDGFGEALTSHEKFTEIANAVKEQGLALAKIADNSKKDLTPSEKIAKGLQESVEKIKEFGNQNSGNIKLFGVAQKDITRSSFTSDTNFARLQEVGQYKQGVPFVADLFTNVILGGDSHGSIAYMDQDAPTNNAAAVAEGGTPSADSYSWTEYTLAGKEIVAYIPISKRQLFDVAFLESEVKRLINTSYRLKENELLTSGDGSGNNPYGYLTRATALSTSSYTGSVANADLVDLINIAEEQIANDGKNAFTPNYNIVNRTDLNKHLLLKKDNDGAPIYPMLRMGGMPSVGNGQLVTNSLVTANSMAVGDFTVGTVYRWGDVSIEMGYINDDLLKNKLTLIARGRLNLLIRNVDQNAIVKVADIDDAIDAIKEVSA